MRDSNLRPFEIGGNKAIELASAVPLNRWTEIVERVLLTLCFLEVSRRHVNSLSNFNEMSVGQVFRMNIVISLRGIILI